ncbi:MAG: polyprenyl synthetase family protein [Candidatus Latescibacterota bacterium]|nr:polyprenyl synthetase family protein [Candidatus Latescibacterota bacterium]
MSQVLGPIQGEIDAFERRLDEMLHSDVEMVNDVARYMAGLKGKRLRPALTVLCAKATEHWNDAVIDASVGVEMIHAATVVHDDIVDGAETRRGQESVNSKWNDHIAVLMGDFLLARALCLLVSLGNLEALGAVSRATERLSQGEIFEFQIGRQMDLKESSYFAMVGDKTASLISAACRIGPLVAGAPRPMVEALTQYGEALGHAFQIADDCLDFTSDAATLGKPVGHDLREGKLTLPLIRALDAAPLGERSEIVGLLRSDASDQEQWDRVSAFVAHYKGVASASDTARQFATQAQQCLMELEASVSRSILETAVRLVVERES